MFSRVKQHVMQILCPLKSVISLGYSSCRTNSTQTHFSVCCTKVQHSVTTILAT